jgi:hypothetical protein
MARRPKTPRKTTAVTSACAAIAALAAVPASGTPSSAAVTAHEPSVPQVFRALSSSEIDRQLRPEEVSALGRDRAEALAWQRAMAQDTDDYPQSTRTASLRGWTQKQKDYNTQFNPAVYGRFRQYFQSPDFAAHVALLPTGKVLLFSFERVETNPTAGAADKYRDTAPTNVDGERNAGRAWLWDPSKGYSRAAFKDVPPPTVDVPDSKDEPRPAPFFCAGHAYLPNGMVGIFGGNLGVKGLDGSGEKLALIFDPWKEKWYREQDMRVGRWYPTVVTGADGRQLIFSGQSENGWGTPTPIVEKFPSENYHLPVDHATEPAGWSLDRFKADAPFEHDYPQVFSLRDGKIYALGRDYDQQWVFDPATETRSNLPNRPSPDEHERDYGSAVALPSDYRGPDSVLILGGDHDDPNTYKLAHGQWTKDKPRHFGRAQDDTLILPDGTLFTVNGSYNIRDYGNGLYNPNADPKYRQIEFLHPGGAWTLGPVQRLPRGYHSNAVLLPDGRVMVTGDELQQLANDPNINDDMNGSIEIYEPWYLFQGSRPTLTGVSQKSVEYDDEFKATTSTPDQVSKAVLVAPVTSTHSVDTSQRLVPLRIKKRNGKDLTLEAPPDANAAPPGYYMLFLLDSKGVPSVAKWVQVNPEMSERG